MTTTVATSQATNQAADTNALRSRTGRALNALFENEYTIKVMIAADGKLGGA